jgi:hypothetical protein
MKCCQVCGGERDTKYYPSKRQRLCRSCAPNTPNKVSREAFDAAYWKGGDPQTVPEVTKGDFYEDYLRSDDSLPDYIKATSSPL